MPYGGTQPLGLAPGEIGGRPAASEEVGRRLRDAVLDASAPTPSPFVGIWGRVSSTNELAKAMAGDARDVLSAGSVLIADSQTHGKGRFGRNWFSPPGGLYLSVLVEPPAASARQHADWLALLPLAAGVALAQAVRRTAGAPAELRWPNDLDRDGGKVAGVLAETGFRRDRPQLAVVGFGINMAPVSLPEARRENGAPAAPSSSPRPPGSLPAGVDRAELTHALVASFQKAVGLLQGEREALRTLWESFSPTARDSRCEVRLGAGAGISGVTDGLDSGGGLRVRLDSGGSQVVRATEAIRIHHGETQR